MPLHIDDGHGAACYSFLAQVHIGFHLPSYNKSRHRRVQIYFSNSSRFANKNAHTNFYKIFLNITIMRRKSSATSPRTARQIPMISSLRCRYTRDDYRSVFDCRRRLSILSGRHVLDARRHMGSAADGSCVADDFRRAPLILPVRASFAD